MMVARAVTLEQMIALNDELIALSRAGIPLDRGLRSVGQDLPGKLGRVADKLAQRLQAGESLHQVVQQSKMFPATYAAVLEAGLRCGRLPAALESIARSARHVAAVRRTYMVGLIYPLLVLLIAYALFAFLLLNITPRMSDIMADFQVPNSDWIQKLASWRDMPIGGLLLPPLGFVLLAGVLWYYTGSPRYLLSRWAQWIPTLGNLRRLTQFAAFAELMSLLVEYDVPLDEAIVLTLSTSGDRKLVADGERFAADLRDGAPLSTLMGGNIPFPPMMSWALSSGQSKEMVGQALRRIADMYRNRAEQLAHWAAVYFPSLAGAIIGGAAALFYALIVFVPFVQTMLHLARP